MGNRYSYKERKGGFTRFLFYFSLILFITSYKITSQSKSINFDRITIDDGLSQGAIISILQDDKGFMWFGTKDGLNRYDGYNFTIFKSRIHM